MTRIWYSICGEGMGHAIRSLVVIQHLSKKHQVFITSYGPAEAFLRKHLGKKVHHIDGPRWIHRQGQILPYQSALAFLWRLPRLIHDMKKEVWPAVMSFGPDILLSDFESTAEHLAKHAGIPTISIDNIQALDKCHIDCPFPPPWYHNASLRMLHPRADRYFILDFAGARPKDSTHTIMTPPLLRKEVQQRINKTKQEDFVVVYQTSYTDDTLFDVLKTSRREFHIYGHDREGREDNLLFEPFDEQRFFNDLVNCSFILTNGGFTLITEAIALRKPILSVMLKHYYEQHYNGYSVERLGFGKMVKRLDEQHLAAFEKELPTYRKALSKAKPHDARTFYARLDQSISELSLR